MKRARWSFYTLLIATAAVTLSAGTSSAQTFTPISSELELGSRGNAVIALQTFLASNPKIYPEALSTGYYGALTREAVIQFQIGYGLPAVGRVGPLTLRVMNDLIAQGKPIDVNAPFIINPSVSATGRNATIAWTTNEWARGKVFYSTSPLSAQEVASAKTEVLISGAVMNDDSYTGTKTVTLQNLSPDTTYFYMIEAIDQSGNVSVIPQASFMSRH